jgi:hypothetical protein
MSSLTPQHRVVSPLSHASHRDAERILTARAFSPGQCIAGRAIMGDSLFRPISSLFAKQNSLLRWARESGCNALELQVELTSAAAEMAGNQQYSLLFSLF